MSDLNNYSSWKIIPDNSFEDIISTEKFIYLLNFAILAPSSHNSQPWDFTVGENWICVLANQERRLKESDKNDRQLYISLGCAIQNILVAADYYGFKTSLEYLLSERCAVKIKLEKSEKTKILQDHLIFSIPKRTNNRNQYDNRVPEEGFLQKIYDLQKEDLKIDVIADDYNKNFIADIAIEAGIAAMDDINFRKELSLYVKPNTTKSKIGMPGFGLGIPTPMSFLVPFLLRWVNLNRISKKSDELLLKKHTPLLILISTGGDDKISWIKAGQVYELIALMAERAGIKTAVWASPIQIGEFYKKLQSILKTDFRPQVLFRMGYTDKITRHSPRMPLSDIFYEH